ncbi:Uncharacterized protein HZ326_12591 [Fusarium oxysporum f. sp. albedinis]|nr:Uncharacterized protein HZ326_12591 [Fusarium oxysporum f. sp. albedinis]
MYQTCNFRVVLNSEEQNSKKEKEVRVDSSRLGSEGNSISSDHRLLKMSYIAERRAFPTDAYPKTYWYDLAQ